MENVAFHRPLILRLPYLHSVEIPQPEKEPSEPFAIALRNGDRIYGQLTAIDDKTVTVRSECHGDIVLLRTEVTSLRRLRGKELLYSGPTAGAPWRAISDRNFGPRKRQLWNSAETGRPMMGSWNSINFLPLALPEQVDVTFHVRSTGLPQFRLYLNSNFGASPSIETWDNILVLVHDGHFALLRTLTPEDRDVNLRICWSQKEKRCAVFTMEGEKIAELSTKESVAQDKSLDIPEDGDDPFGGRGRIARQEGKPEAGICLHNTGINLELETLRVREWNGSPPQKIKPDQIRIELADGSVIPGNILHSDAAGILVQKTDGGQKTMPLEGVEAIVLGSDPMLGKHTGTELWFADGTFLSGKLTEIQNGVASLQTLFSVNPIQSKITTLKHINFRVPKSAGDGDEPALAELDRLVLGKDTLHGVPVGGGDALLRWMPVGGVQSIPLASGSDAELIRSIKADSTVTKAPALFFLTNGDILPGELRGMDESMVDIHSSISTLGRVPVANFHAIQFSGPDYNPDGFTDPGWRTLKGDSK
ncbi:MAG: hypothetical protein WCN98_05330, partial [Verrucomicrobiaceae bacterium]